MRHTHALPGQPNKEKGQDLLCRAIDRPCTSLFPAGEVTREAALEEMAAILVNILLSQHDPDQP